VTKNKNSVSGEEIDTFFSLFEGDLNPINDKNIIMHNFDKREIKLNGENIEALQDLETICRRNGNNKRLVQLLERQFLVFEKLENKDSLRRVFEELVPLYRETPGNREKTYQLYIRMANTLLIEPEEISRILAWRDVEVDWLVLYSKISVSTNDLESGLKKARYHKNDECEKHPTPKSYEDRKPYRCSRVG